MALPKRVPKIAVFSNKSVINTITKSVKQGQTLSEISSKLKSRNIQFTNAQLSEAFRSYASGNGFVKQLERFKPSERLPDYFFQPAYGRALRPYKVNTTLRLHNDLLGTDFYRTIELQFDVRPTKRLIDSQLSEAQSLLKENSNVTMTDFEIDYFSKSVR